MSASAARSFVRACARGEAGRVGATRGGGAGRRGAAGGQVAGTPVLAALRSLASYSVPPLARRTYVALAPAPAPTPAPAAARYTRHEHATRLSLGASVCLDGPLLEWISGAVDLVPSNRRSASEFRVLGIARTTFRTPICCSNLPGDRCEILRERGSEKEAGVLFVCNLGTSIAAITGTSTRNPRH